MNYFHTSQGVRPFPTSVLLLLVLSGHACHSQAVQWHDFDTAKEKARDEQKLVMVVQGPDDVSLSLEQCATAKAFQTAALADARLRDFYNYRVVATYRATGLPQLEPATRARTRKKPNKPSHENVVTYFCRHDHSGDLQVIHFIVGFPTSTLLQTECDWAYTTLDAVKSQASEELSKALSEAHLQRLVTLGETVPAFATRPSLNDTLKLAAQFRDTRLLARFGAGWTPDERVKLVGSLRPHADLQATIGHRILALHPQITLSLLEQPAFEQLTKQEYWRPPTRREEIAKWFHLQRERNRPLLVIVSSTDAGATSELGNGFDHRVWQPKRATIRQNLRAFDSIELSRTELICLMRDLDLTLPDQKTFNELRFLLFDRLATDTPVLVTEEDESKLQRVMERTISD